MNWCLHILSQCHSYLMRKQMSLQNFTSWEHWVSSKKIKKMWWGGKMIFCWECYVLFGFPCLLVSFVAFTFCWLLCFLGFLFVCCNSMLFWALVAIFSLVYFVCLLHRIDILLIGWLLPKLFLGGNLSGVGNSIPYICNLFSIDKNEVSVETRKIIRVNGTFSRKICVSCNL